MDEPSDIALMEHITLRNTDGLRALFNRYGHLAFALAYRVVGEVSAAEEIVHDAFETVWNKGHSFDAAKGGNVRGWLMTMVHHRAIDQRRRELDRPSRRLLISTMDNVLSTPDAWGNVSASLLGEEVRKALDTLPVDQRRAIEVAYFDGLSHGEIASQEDEPPETISGRLQFGLRTLSGTLETSTIATGRFGEERA